MAWNWKVCHNHDGRGHVTAEMVNWQRPIENQASGDYPQPLLVTDRRSERARDA